MRTVLMLGAGASAASKFRLPTMAAFFEPSLLTDPGTLAQFLRWFYGSRPQAEWNLEEVLSHADLQRAREGAWLSQHAVNVDEGRRIYSELFQYLSKRLQIGDGDCPLHKALFARLDGRDSIISVNYDLVADQSLRALEPKDWANRDRSHDSPLRKLPGLLGRLNLWNDPPPSLLARERTEGFYLKLHGSLDWLHCSTPGCYNSVNLFVTSLSKLADGQLPGMPCRYCGAALRVMIVPPVAQKHIDDTGRLAFLWHLAWRELVEADRVVVFGMSVPPPISSCAG